MENELIRVKVLAVGPGGEVGFYFQEIPKSSWSETLNGAKPEPVTPEPAKPVEPTKPINKPEPIVVNELLHTLSLTVGKFFEFFLPANLFSGEPDNIDIGSLPSGLQWDGRARLIYGAAKNPIDKFMLPVFAVKDLGTPEEQRVNTVLQIEIKGKAEATLPGQSDKPNLPKPELPNVVLKPDETDAASEENGGYYEH